MAKDGLKRVTVNVDGGSRGNPGPAAAAAVAHDESGEVLTDRSKRIGKTTNNVAEYEALLLGIELARDLEAEEVELVNDSELIAHQVRGEWKVKHAPLQKLRDKVLKALEGFDHWSVRTVRREQNEAADALVNEALDG